MYLELEIGFRERIRLRIFRKKRKAGYFGMMIMGDVGREIDWI
jgi:hypothetical protein